jgi:hypothetical protein
VGKKAAHVVSNSELESLYLSLIDNKEILQCFLNLPCCSFNKEKEKRPKKHRKSSAVTHSLASDGNNNFCDSNAEYCYLNLPDVMVEDNPCCRLIIPRTVQEYFWHARPRSDATRVTRPDR